MTQLYILVRGGSPVKPLFCAKHRTEAHPHQNDQHGKPEVTSEPDLGLGPSFRPWAKRGRDGGRLYGEASSASSFFSPHVSDMQKYGRDLTDPPCNLT